MSQRLVPVRKVRLLSGGPNMTAVGEYDGLCICEWFLEDGTLCRWFFPPDALVPAE